MRRIFLKKLTGKLQLHFSPENQATLLFHQGRFLGDEKYFMPVLRDCLSKPVAKFAWEATDTTKETIKKSSGWVVPWIALSEALRDLPIDSQRLVSYHHAFTNLPPMLLKSCPIHRIDFADAESYLLLYQLSLGAPSFDLKIFFLGNLNKEDLTKHIRTVLLVFLLGYLRSAPKKESTDKNVSIVSRILNRFKAKGAA